MSNRVLVTGIGMVSAMGTGVENSLSFAKKGKSPVAAPRFLDTLQRDFFPLAEVPFSDQELMAQLGLKENRVYSRTSLLAMTAAKEAAIMAGIQPGEHVELISGTSVGGMDKGEKLYNGFVRKQGDWDLHNALVHDCGESTQTMAQYLRIQGKVITISTACSSAANAIMQGSRLIRSGKAKKVIAGGTDALTRFTINGFRSLMILSDELCTPFDKNRKGLNLGEGAGYVVLEAEEEVAKEGRTALCEVSGYANTCDAYHQTASSPDGNGAWLAIKGALRQAQIEPSEISYINAHGTATPNNDLSEGIALKRVFGEILPPFSSTKALTGHTLGAAGGIEAVLCAISIKKGILFPNLHFQTPIEEVGQAPVTEWLENQVVHHVLSNSFGFGGNNTSLVFSAC
jgi:3-oxoacyl-[acyl-carrier-protein] synthase-1